MLFNLLLSTSCFAPFNLTATETIYYFQEISEMDESSTSQFEGGKLRNCRHPSPVSILEPSFSNESCDSSLTTESNISTGGIRSIVLHI